MCEPRWPGVQKIKLCLMAVLSQVWSGECLRAPACQRNSGMRGALEAWPIKSAATLMVRKKYIYNITSMLGQKNPKLLITGIEILTRLGTLLSWSLAAILANVGSHISPSKNGSHSKDIRRHIRVSPYKNIWSLDYFASCLVKIWLKQFRMFAKNAICWPIWMSEGDEHLIGSRGAIPHSGFLRNKSKRQMKMLTNASFCCS